MPLWNELVGRKHCAIRIQGFFEYNKEQNITYRIERRDGQPFYIAGLWDIWIDIKTNVLIPTCAMITVPLNESMAAIHDLMPAMMDRGDVKNWINGNLKGAERVRLLRSRPCRSEDLKVSVHKKG